MKRCQQIKFLARCRNKIKSKGIIDYLLGDLDCKGVMNEK